MTALFQNAQNVRLFSEHTHTHTFDEMHHVDHKHTHTRLTALFCGTRKVKPIWILPKQETVSGSGISWAICKFAPRSRQITTPAPHHSLFLQARCPSCRPTNSGPLKWCITSYRPGGGETVCPCQRLFYPKLRQIYVHPQTGPQSAHLWWPVVAKLQAASVPIAWAAAPLDRQMDGSRYLRMPR